MSTDTISEKMDNLINGSGYRYKTISVNHLPEAESELQSLYGQGTLEESLFRERLAPVRYNPSKFMEGAQTVLIVAVPQPTVIVLFSRKGLEHPVVIPPTYDLSTDTVIADGLNKILKPQGYRAQVVPAPWKYLAVRSGLAEYGKNNIVYIPGRGSFHRLVAFITDWPFTEDHWDTPRMMDRCKRCRACIIFCPTKAIDEQRFIIHAERCITFHNELTRDLPDFINPSWHHCLLGCLQCQNSCPENKETKKIREERERFDEEETSLILQGTPLEKLPAATRQKLEHLSLAEDYSLIPRNLGLLL
jgi:epoxyqueuosine reductase